MELFNYLLKVSTCSVLFFAFYLLVLRKLTFFKINRFYLLFSVLLSFVIPALQITVEREVVTGNAVKQPIAAQNVDMGGPAFQDNIVVGTEPVVYEAEPVDWYGLLTYIYVAAVAGLLFLAVWRVYQLLKHTLAPVKEINGLKLVAKQSGFTNCSFFNYVFIDEQSLTQSELAVLLAHEEVHARQFHSVDKLLLMIAKAFLWFNPVIYLYDKALEQMHEYEADEATSENIGTDIYAALLLRLAVHTNSNPLIHNFVKSPIKQRIKMLFNSKSKKMKKLAYLLALPIGLGLIWGFTIDVVNVSPQEFTLVIDAGHGGKNKGATVNGVSEKEIALSMSKKLKTLAEQKGIKVITTRNDDSQPSIKDRVATTGNFLISLHVNSSPKGNTANGIEMFTTNSSDKLKYVKAVGMTYHLYKSLKDVSGIAVANKPREGKFYVLENSTLPGVILELGYLTNKNDFQFITDEKKQDELAKAIIDGVLNYQKYQKGDGEMKAMLKDSEERSAAYEAWRNSDKYKLMVAKAAKIKAQTMTGEIESLHYFSTRKILDGFILKSKGERYRVYLTKEQIKQVKLEVGDAVTVKVKKGEVWFDSNYPVVQPIEILSKAATKLKLTGTFSANATHAKDQQKNYEFSAKDSTVFDKKDNVVHLYGKARLKNSKEEIKANEIHYNLKTKQRVAVGLNDANGKKLK